MSPRKKKTYLAIMALGGFALLVDRVLLPAPARGSDAGVPQSAAIAEKPAADTTGVAEPTAGQAIPELPFPHGLSVYRAGAEFRDLFAPPDSQWPQRVREHASDKTGSARDAETQRATTAAVFAGHHTLSGVIMLGRRTIAVVDGEWVRIGQSVNGCVVTAIRDNETVFRCSDGDAVLRVVALTDRPEG